MVTIIATVVLLGALIFVHELGHFLMAKAVGVRVERFSMGFPPKMIGKKIGETEYLLSWIPLGGYVKMFGENPDDSRSVPPEEEHRSFSHKPTWARFLIVLAGPGFNFLFAFFVFWCMFFWSGIEHLGTEVGRVTQDLSAARAGLRPGDRIVAVNGDPVLYFDQVDERVREGGGRTLDLSIQRDGQTRIIRVTPRKTMERTIFGEEAEAYAIGLEPHLSAIVGALTPDMPALAAGVEVGDRIVSLGGKPVRDWYDVLNLIRANGEGPLEVVLERRGRRITKTITPKMVANQGVTGKNEPVPMIGIQRRDQTLIESVGPVSAVKYAGLRTWELSRLTVLSVVKLVQRKLSIKTLGGPIFIAEMAGQQAKAGLLPLISLAALLSINLGILNLLPIPVLDGGHLFFFFLEIIFRRPININIRERAQQVGMIFLLLFMAFIFYNDLARLVTRWDKASPEQTIEQPAGQTENTRP